MRAEQGGLRQVSIEARIVEATDNFTRKLGVQWGAGVSGRVGACLLYTSDAADDPPCLHLGGRRLIT